jgi:hypothetical protein
MYWLGLLGLGTFIFSLVGLYLDRHNIDFDSIPKEYHDHPL